LLVLQDLTFASDIVCVSQLALSRIYGIGGGAFAGEERYSVICVDLDLLTYGGGFFEKNPGKGRNMA
jgi:hypothetical protein